MVGNDVVDLLDPESDSSKLHPRWDARVFSDAERSILAASDEPGRCRWRMWAAKEAAYKVARKRSRETVFSPPRFVVALHVADVGDAALAGLPGGRRSWRGEVVHANRAYPVCVEEGDEAIHAIAIDGEVPRDRLVAGVRRLMANEIDGEGPGGPGRAARRLALGRVAPHLGVPAAGLSIEREDRVPVLRARGEALPADLSLSHHGALVAFACEIAPAMSAPTPTSTTTTSTTTASTTTAPPAPTTTTQTTTEGTS